MKIRLIAADQVVPDWRNTRVYVAGSYESSDGADMTCAKMC